MNARFLDGTVKDGNVVITVVDEDKCELVELDFRQGAGTFFGVLAHALAKAGELVFSAMGAMLYCYRCRNCELSAAGVRLRASSAARSV
jgi:hypothetical protein